MDGDILHIVKHIGVYRVMAGGYTPYSEAYRYVPRNGGHTPYSEAYRYVPRNGGHTPYSEAYRYVPRNGGHTPYSEAYRYVPRNGVYTPYSEAYRYVPHNGDILHIVKHIGMCRIMAHNFSIFLNKMCFIHSYLTVP